MAWPQFPNPETEKHWGDVQAVADPVEHFGPALHGDTLVDCQHGKANVIKVGDAVVGTFPVRPTLRAIDHTATSVTSLSAGSRQLTFCCGVDICGLNRRDEYNFF